MKFSSIHRWVLPEAPPDFCQTRDGLDKTLTVSGVWRKKIQNVTFGVNEDFYTDPNQWNPMCLFQPMSLSHHDHDLVRLGQLGLLGNESQLLKWRLSLCSSSENILYHLKGENVPKSTEQFLCASSFFFISAKWTKVSAWSFVEKEHVSFARLACLYVLVCVVVLQNENFEGKHRRRPSVNSNNFSKQKNFLRSLGLLGNESQLLKWRLSLCRSSENILYHFEGENVPKSTEQFLFASSFFFISAKWTKVSAWSFVEKEHVSFARLACLYVLVCVVVLQNENFECEHRRRPSVNSNNFSKQKNFLRSLGLLGNESQLLKWRLSLCSSSENILYHLKGENVPKSTEQFLFASSFFFISAKWTKVSAWSFVEKEHVSFARLACLYVFVCVVVLQNEKIECEHRRRPSVNSNSFSNEKNFLRSLNLSRETWKRFTFLGRMSLSCKARMIFCFRNDVVFRNFFRRMRVPILLKSSYHSDDSQLSGFECEFLEWPNLVAWNRLEISSKARPGCEVYHS